MNTFDLLIMLWALPSMIAFLMMITIDRCESGNNPEDYDKEDWLLLIGFSVLYTLSFIQVVIFIFEKYAKFLVKEI